MMAFFGIITVRIANYLLLLFNVKDSSSKVLLCHSVFAAFTVSPAIGLISFEVGSKR